MVNKFKKTSIRKQQTDNQTEAVKIIEKDVMEGKLTNWFRNLHIYFIHGLSNPSKICYHICYQ